MIYETFIDRIKKILCEELTQQLSPHFPGYCQIINEDLSEDCNKEIKQLTDEIFGKDE